MESLFFEYFCADVSVNFGGSAIIIGIIGEDWWKGIKKYM